MLRPFLIIGVGGSGGKTLRVVRDDLERRLAQAGWGGPFPKAWQFVHVDVPTHADGNDPDLPPQLPERDYQGLVANGVDYRTIDAALMGGGAGLRDVVASWRPDPNKVAIPASKGAGQYRALGRIITVAGLARVREAVQAARRAMTGAEIVGELQALTSLLGGKPAASPPEPTVIVVSSIAGGSGAGAVIDVCDVVRSLGDKWADQIVGLLYAPDVFDYLPEESRRGVRPNSLATLAEILSGYWNSDGASEETTALFARYGVQLGAMRRSGPRYPFLVGSRNNSVTYATQNDIYRALGRSVASWVASSGLQDKLSAYVHGNWSQVAASVPDRLPLKTREAETPFTALGSARVGLGRDRFRDYASEHLARTAMLRLLRRHEELRAPGDDRTEKQLVLDTANSVFGGFLRQSRLDERGEEHNDVIDALRPERQNDEAKALVAQILGRIEQDLPPKGEAPARVATRVVNAINDRSAAYLDAQRTARVERARRWVGEIQEHVTTFVARQVVLHGAPVTEQLVRKLETELRQVRDELRSEAALYRRWAASLSEEVQKAFGDGEATVVLAQTPTLRTAVQNGVQTLVYVSEAEVRELAAGLVVDLAESVLDPLATAVQHAYQRGSQEWSQGGDQQQSIASSWPEGDVIPVRLRPAPNEFLLEPVDEYPSILADLVRRSVTTSDATGHRREADMQVLLGQEELEGTRQALIRRTTSWVPSDPSVNPSATAAPSRASFAVAASPDDVLARAGEWLTRDGTAVGRYMSEGLRDFLDAKNVSPAEHDRRLQRFEGQLIAALNAAEPLVSINASVLVQVHGRQEPRYATSFSEIPLPDKSAARATFRRVLEARGQWSEEIATSFGDSASGFVDVFTVLGEPYEPVVFDSLMRPIAQEWGARNKQPDSRAEFWRWRRARPVTEFVPMSPSVLDSMVRGWFVAGALGHLQMTDTSVSVFVPHEAGAGGRYAAFPTPMLESVPTQGPEAIAAVLESVVLAMVQVNADESMAAMEPYQRLRVLGQFSSGSDTADESGPSAELTKYVLEGVNRNTDRIAVPEDWKARRDDAEARFRRIAQQYEAHFAKLDQRPDAVDMPRTYDLRAQILSALGELSRAVEGLEPLAQDGGTMWT